MCLPGYFSINWEDKQSRYIGKRYIRKLIKIYIYFIQKISVLKKKNHLRMLCKFNAIKLNKLNPKYLDKINLIFFSIVLLFVATNTLMIKFHFYEDFVFFSIKDMLHISLKAQTMSKRDILLQN